MFTAIGLLLIAPAIYILGVALWPVLSFALGFRRVNLTYIDHSTGESTKISLYHEKGDDLDDLLSKIEQSKGAV